MHASRLIGSVGLRVGALRRAVCNKQPQEMLQSPPTRLLWLAPTLNHYRVPTLIALGEEVDLLVLAGTGRAGKGDVDVNWAGLSVIQVDVPKSRFGWSISSLSQAFKLGARRDWMLVPAETKLIPLLCLAWLWRRFGSGPKLVSYTHLRPKLGSKWLRPLETSIARAMYALYDRVVFYTSSTRDSALRLRLLPRGKAGFANNTVYTPAINSSYEFAFPTSAIPTLLYIGRLIPSKKIDQVIGIFQQLTATLGPGGVKLEIIGDGPMADHVREASRRLPGLVWHGSTVDEGQIARVMLRAWALICPVNPGLAINHGLAHGRPMVTTVQETEAPEFSYLTGGVNALITGSGDELHPALVQFLSDRSSVEELCRGAHATGQELTTEKWVKGIVANLL